MNSHWFEQEEKGSDESRTAYAHPAFEAPKWIQGGQLELRKPDSLQQTESVMSMVYNPGMANIHQTSPVHMVVNSAAFLVNPASINTWEL